MRWAESVTAEELEYTRRSLTYGRQFNLEFESEEQSEETENSSFYAAAVGMGDEIEKEMELIEENVDAFLDDCITADLGIYSGGADNRREHINSTNWILKMKKKYRNRMTDSYTIFSLYMVFRLLIVPGKTTFS